MEELLARAASQIRRNTVLKNGILPQEEICFDKITIIFRIIFYFLSDLTDQCHNVIIVIDIIILPYSLINLLFCIARSSIRL